VDSPSQQRNVLWYKSRNETLNNVFDFKLLIAWHKNSGSFAVADLERAVCSSRHFPFSLSPSQSIYEKMARSQPNIETETQSIFSRAKTLLLNWRVKRT
jgi:hypothetical protein